MFTQSLLLAGIHYAEGLLWLGTLSIMLDRMRRSFLQSGVRGWLEGLSGAMIVGFGARLAFAPR